MKAYQPKNIKENNKDLLLRLLKSNHHAMTKRELSQVSNLSVVTINKLIPELLADQVIEEMDQPIETGGRHAVAYRFNASHQLILVNQFIEDNHQMIVNFYVVDLLGRMIDQDVLVDITQASFVDMVSQIKHTYPAISVAVTGIPGSEHNNRLKIMDFAPFKDIDLNAIIRDAIQVDSYIENDINAATLGFASDNTPVLSGIYFPEYFPPGAALIINQWIFKGHNNLSGEVKHLPSLHPLSYPLPIEKRVPLIQESIQSLVALYDPSDILIFIPKAWASQINTDTLRQRLSDIFSYDLITNIHMSHQFSKFYLEGLIKVGLDKLN